MDSGNEEWRLLVGQLGQGKHRQDSPGLHFGRAEGGDGYTELKLRRQIWASDLGLWVIHKLIVIKVRV